MKKQLWNKFLDKNLIKNGTTVHARVKTTGFGHDRIDVMKDLSVINANNTGGLGHWVRDHQETFTFQYDTVTKVDSMTPDRLAKAYGIE
jgi:hypothetical protein